MIAGTLNLNAQNQAFIWQPASGAPTGIGTLPLTAPPCGSTSEAFSKGAGISGDGSTIVGGSASNAFCDGEAYKWTSQTGLQALGCPINPVGLCFQNAAAATNSNGSVIVGTALRSGAVLGSPWVYNGSYNCFLDGCAGMNNPVSASANGVSADGTTVVGGYNSGQQNALTVGYVYNASTNQTTFVGQLPNGQGSQLVAVNSNGTIAVGNAFDNSGQHAVIWTASLGLQRLDTLLAAAGATAVQNGSAQQATGISNNGTVIVGIGDYGNAPNGFVAVLPAADLASLETLSVTVTGSGTVTSGDGKINCGSTCTAPYTQGAMVSLVATAANGSMFAGWGGACGGVGSCIVTMSQAQSVTATFQTGSTPTSPLVAAILPASRSATLNNPVTAFATIINTGSTSVSQCAVTPAGGQLLNFTYQTTSPTTNALTGTANTPAAIGPGGAQSFVIGPTPTATFSPTQVPFSFACGNVVPAPSVAGLNTLLLSASATAVPDVVALAATASNDGILHIPNGSNSFAVATVNLGSSDTITASVNTNGASLPLNLTLCQTNQTNPSTGQCLAASSTSVSTTIATNATPTFGIFGTATGTIPFNPAGSRVFVQFTDSGNNVRGETSVAVKTQ